MFKQANPFPGLDIDAETYYYLCSASLTETSVVCACHGSLEKSLGGRVHLLISSDHEFLMQMYEVSDYSIIDYGGNVLDHIDQNGLSNRCRKPAKGKIFVANPYSHGEFRKECEGFYYGITNIRYIEWLQDFLGLPRTSFDGPKNIPKLTKRLDEKCRKIGGIENIALICPDSYYLPSLRVRFWESLAEELRRSGVVAICYCANPSNRINGTEYFDMTIRDAVEIAVNGRGAYMARNGLCDVLFFLAQRLHVFYSSYAVNYIYNLSDCYGLKDIDEQMVLYDREYY